MMSTEPEQVTVVPEEKKAKKVKKEKPKKTVKQEIMSWILTILAALVIAVVVRVFLFEPIRVDGESMRNTLQDNEIVLVTKPKYLKGNYERGDVVICRYPERSKTKSLNLGGSFEVDLTTHTLFVKRLIALPGDKLEIRAGVVYVNDQQVDESHIDTYIESHSSFGPIVLGPDAYFVMGDNRGNSNDSRRVGPISSDMIVGHVECVIWPLSEFGKKIN